jgi:hypothetical protein
VEEVGWMRKRAKDGSRGQRIRSKLRKRNGIGQKRKRK